MNGEIETNANPSGVQGVCPNGWHLPSNAEWQELITHIGGSNVAGGKLKSTSTSHWASPNIGATNESGFSAVASGWLGTSSGFWYLSYGVSYWTSTKEDAINIYTYALDYDYTETFNPTLGINNKLTVRCIKN